MKHKHKINRRGLRGFSGPAPGATKANPSAHGCVAYHDYCACGATRVVNVNGRHMERGEWISPAATN